MKEMVERIHQSKGNPCLANLSDVENEALKAGMERLYEIGMKAKEKGVRILVDAEYTYMNPGISVGALAMMLAFNKDEVVVANTYQCYLKAAMDTIREDIDIVLANDCCFGAKVVRGAYMEKERQRASKLGYPDPINDTYADTCTMYDAVISHMLQSLISNGSKQHHVTIATHNQNSLFNAIQAMAENKLPKDSDKVVFGQIFGMERTNFNAFGYNVI